MAKITLSKALKLRKKIRSFCDSHSMSIRSNQLSFVKTDEEPTFGENSINFIDYFNEYEQSLKDMAFINTLIDSANNQKVENASIRGCINILEKDKNWLTTLDCLVTEKKNFKEKAIVWNPRKFNEKTKELGDEEIIFYRNLVSESNIDLIAERKKVKKEISMLEDNIERLNSIIMLEIDDRIIEAYLD